MKEPDMTKRRTFGPSFTLDSVRSTAHVADRAHDTAHKTEVARFQGKHYVAEREDDELVVYALHDDLGMPAQDSHTTDRRVSTLGDLNRFNADHYRRRKSA
jgi:hypothetical protein